MAKTELTPTPIIDPRQERLNEINKIAPAAHALLQQLALAENQARVAASRMADLNGRQAEEALARHLADAATHARQAFAHASAAFNHMSLTLYAESEANAGRRAK